MPAAKGIGMICFMFLIRLYHKELIFSNEEERNIMNKTKVK